MSCVRLNLSVLLVLFLVFTGCSSSPEPASTSSESPKIAFSNVNFANELLLLHNAVEPKDDHNELVLRFQASQKLSSDYVLFVHALDKNDGIAFQFDHPLKNAVGASTGSWAAGESVEDRFLTTPPPGHLPGKYTLRVGVYCPTPLKFLNVIQTNLPRPANDWKGHSVLIEQVECK